MRQQQLWEKIATVVVQSAEDQISRKIAGRVRTGTVGRQVWHLLDSLWQQIWEEQQVQRRPPWLEW